MKLKLESLFFDGTINGKTYTHMLKENKILTQMQQHSGDRKKTFSMPDISPMGEKYYHLHSERMQPHSRLAAEFPGLVSH
jgi:hypothetical protein